MYIINKYSIFNSYTKVEYPHKFYSRTATGNHTNDTVHLSENYCDVKLN